MKENYDTEQEIAIVEFAKKWNVTPEEVRRHLDGLQSKNFERDLKTIEDYIKEGLK